MSHGLTGDAAEVERLRAQYGSLVEVIRLCRDRKGLKPSPDGPTGDVRNLVGLLDLAERRITRLHKALGSPTED